MIRPTLAATSRPTVSTSSIGPIGMPNFTAALSIATPGTPSANAVAASSMYGNSTRLTRKPGVPATGTGSLPSALQNAARRCCVASAIASWWMISTSGISATGLK